MSDKKHNNFIVMIFLLGIICLYCIAVSATRLIDVIISMIIGQSDFVMFSKWLEYLESGTIVIMLLIFALSLILLMIALLLYRKELSKKTLVLLYTLPAAVVVWTFISNIPTELFLHYSNDSLIIELVCRICSLAVISVYAGFALKSMIKEIEFD